MENAFKAKWEGHRWKEAMEACRSFNHRLLQERAARQPYLDSHSGVEQTRKRQYDELKRRVSRKPDQKVAEENERSRLVVAVLMVAKREIYHYIPPKWVCRSRPPVEEMCPNDPPDRPPTPETAFDEQLARHLANNDSEVSEEESDPAYGQSKRKRKQVTRRRGRKSGF